MSQPFFEFFSPVAYLGASKPTLVKTLEGQATSGSNLTTYTFNTFDIGDAGPRLLVICFGGEGTGTPTITGATVGGLAMSVVVNAAGNTQPCGIWQLNIPEGHSLISTTTATVTVTFSSGQTRAMAQAYTLRNLDSVNATNTNANTGTDPITTTLTIQGEGVGIAIACIANSGAATWSGLTEDIDISAGGGDQESTASLLPAVLQSSLTVGANFAGAGNASVAAAAWY